MNLPYYVVDAFVTERSFSGNPAGVCPLKEWPDARLMQSIATQNNLSETAFFVEKEKGHFGLRWFTPEAEVDLCGHATLGSAFVIFSFLHPELQDITFETKSGELLVSRAGDLIELRFPSRPAQAVECPGPLKEALGIMPEFVGKARDYVAVLSSEQEVLGVKPDLQKLRQLDAIGILVTAPGKDCDFVSRAFFPAVGIPEDPVTGSAHCTLIPYWAERLGKSALRARQLSPRGGELLCRLDGKQVLMAGRARLFLRGEMTL